MDILRAYVLVSLAFLVPSIIFLSRLPEPAPLSVSALKNPQARVFANVLDVYPERRYVIPTSDDARFWRRPSKQ